MINPLIIKRKSIRNYVGSPFNAEETSRIEDIINAAEPLIKGIAYEVKMMDDEEFKSVAGGLFLVQAPHYLVIRSEKKEGCYLNAGFIGQQIVLNLTALNFATCWLGGARSRGAVSENGMEYMVAISVGKTVEDFRAAEGDAIRDPLSKLINGDTDAHLDALIAARLAPSAMNSQPARYLCADNKIHVFRKRAKNLLGLMERLQSIDCGIAMANIKFNDPKYKFIREENPPKLSGCAYMGTMKR